MFATKSRAVYHNITSLRRIALPNLIILSLLVAGIFSVGLPTTVAAGPPHGVDHLRGRWDGIIADLGEADQPFLLLLQDFTPDPGDPDALVAGGCMSVGEDGVLTPLSARAVDLGGGEFDLTLFGTASFSGGSFVIKMTGSAETLGAGVPDDSASGDWLTMEQAGVWSALHHDRRRPKCPAVDIGDELKFMADVYAGVGIEPDGSRYAGTILESYTNIVSSAVQVDLPDGSTVVIPSFTDLFSPDVDFIDQFRFLGSFGGYPQTGGPYTFTLLDVYGEPIAGATTMDIWLECNLDAPRNVSASIESDGILVNWDPVAPVPGFDPGGSPSQGFYQIELGPEFDDPSGSGYGASDIHQTSHLIPFASFGDPADGIPDGFDFGNALEELGDGPYGFDVIAFADAPPAGGGHGLECQVRAQDEHTSFAKSGNDYTISP
jgi:hypothetical protein